MDSDSKIQEVKGSHKALQIQKFLASCRAAARTSLNGQFPNGLEHFGILLTDEAWIARFPDTVRPDYPTYPEMHGGNATQAVISVYKEEKEKALAVNKARNQLVTAMLGALDSVDLGSLFNSETGHADVTPAMIVEFMISAHGTITDGDIDFAKAQTMTAFDPSQWSITNWLADKEQGYSFLDSIDSETSAPDQYRNLVSACRNSPPLKRIVEKYLSDTEMPDRTFNHLKNFLVNQWAKTQTTSNMVRAAFAGSAMASSDFCNASEDEGTETSTVALAAIGHTAGKRTVEECEKEIAALKGSLRVASHYCFADGYGGHSGTQCKRMTAHDTTSVPGQAKPRIIRSPYTAEMTTATEPKSLKDSNGKLCKGNAGVEKGYRKN
jgi:hypothetical protein